MKDNLKHDTIKKFWVVTTPTKLSTLNDICFETTVKGMMIQSLGGLKSGEIRGIFKTRDVARIYAEELLHDDVSNPDKKYHEERAKFHREKEEEYRHSAEPLLRARAPVQRGMALASEISAEKSKSNPTPKKGEPRVIEGTTFYYIGKTEYWTKALLIKDWLKGKGLGVAITGNRTKKLPTTKQRHSGIYYYIWATIFVYVPMMETGGNDLFMEGEYNPKRKVRK
jgi:hypothetical protein